MDGYRFSLSLAGACALLVCAQRTTAEDVAFRGITNPAYPAISAKQFPLSADTELTSFLEKSYGCDSGCDCGDFVAFDDDCCGNKKSAKPDPCATSHKMLFYNNDFSYLNDPCYNGCCLGDRMKQRSLGACGQWGTLDFGGQYRLRYHHEVGMGNDVAQGRRFEDTRHDFWLNRIRLFGNWQVNDSIRVFAEGIYADTSSDNGTYVPRLIDQNYGDFLNLFVDLKLTEQTTVRLGRQELLYGVERTISPLDWANTRRTFDGVKVMYHGDQWNVDGFWTQFVPPDYDDFDQADSDIQLYGLYGTYGGWENSALDLYYIGYDNRNAGAIVSDFSLHTLGARLHGSVDEWLYEMEGGPQFGRQSGLAKDQKAFFGTAGIGRKMGRCWDPTLWLYWDYASGDNGSGDWNRFNQLFPLAHKYFGFIDAVQRANISSPNALLTMKPTKNISLLAWYWHFMAAEQGDIVPSLGGQPTQNTSSNDLGDELDLILKYGIGPRSNILFGWSHFWRGNKITGPKDADFFYTQWTQNF
jgi:alginate export protein